jgi:hypothetical protein
VDLNRARGWWLRTKGFAARHATVLVVLGMTAVSATALAGVRWEAGQREDATARSDDRARAQICTALESAQDTDRLLINTVLDDPDDGGGVPLLDVEAYNDLPPSVQQYVRELAAAQVPGPDDARSLAERLEAFRDEHLGRDDLPTFCHGGPP